MIDMTLEEYIKGFAKLRVDRTGPWTADTNNGAPYKPILLLAIFDLIEQGEIKNNFIELTPELVDLYRNYCRKVLPSDRITASIALPFFHLKSDKFWLLIPKPGKEVALQHTTTADRLLSLKGLLLGASFTDRLYQLIQLPENRNSLRLILLQKYFSPALQTLLQEQMKLTEASFRYSQKLLASTQTQFKLKETAEGTTFYVPQVKEVRTAGFRRTVVKIYDHRCSMCGIRILTEELHTAVNAAHIIPWSVSYNDDPRNGLALCGLCHWVFDEGLAAISKNYTVMLSRQLAVDKDNVPGHLSTLAGRGIILPSIQNFWPDSQAIDWHRQFTFK